MNKLFIIIVLSIALVLPTSVDAASGTMRVRQTADDGTTPVNNGSTGASGSLDHTAPQIFNVSVEVKYNSATINWQTNENSITKISWGKSADYSIGNSLDINYTKNHTTVINSLSDNTQYQFLIESVDAWGNVGKYGGVFIILALPDLVPPKNVSGFVASPMTDKIELKWKNPIDSDFAFVRLVRSTKFYPIDPYNGEVIYEGGASSFMDLNVSPGTVYYYSIFTKDFSGNFSSGSLAYAMIAWFSELGSDGVNPSVPIVDVDLPNSIETPDRNVKIEDFTFSYNEGQVVLDANNLEVPSSAFLEISIPKNKLPSTTSFVIAKLDSNYLFNYDAVSEKYVLLFPRMNQAGNLNLKITIFNSSKQILREINGFVKIIGEDQVKRGGSLLRINWFAAFIIPILSLLLILAILIILRLYKRRE